MYRPSQYLSVQLLRLLPWLAPLAAAGSTSDRTPAALDPALVAPHIFEVALENAQVRVLEVTDRNGETQPLHSHPPRLVIHMSPCAWLVTDAGGERSMQSHKFGDMYWEDAVTHGGRTSTVVQECRLIEVEIKAPP